MSSNAKLKCATCLITIVADEGLRNHHKSKLHQYNLRRTLAGLSPVNEEVYLAKLRLLADQQVEKKGGDHIKKKPSHKPTKQSESKSETCPDKYLGPHHCFIDNKLFDNELSCLRYMEHRYDFFIQDKEYLVDLPGYLTYLGDMVFEANVCIFCMRPFKSPAAVQQHMIDMGHTSLGADEIEPEIEPFYDYRPYFQQLGNDDDNDDLPDSDDEEAWDTFFHKRKLNDVEVDDLGHLTLTSGRKVAPKDIAYVYHQRKPVANGTQQLSLINKCDQLSRYMSPWENEAKLHKDAYIHMNEPPLPMRVKRNKAKLYHSCHR